MSRKPPSYPSIEMPQSPSAVQPSPNSARDSETAHLKDRAALRTLKEASEQVMLYLHPAAAKALKRYAVDQNTRVHSLLIEAVEEWFRKHGLREPVRAETARSRGEVRGS